MAFSLFARMGVVAAATIGTTRLGIWDNSVHTTELCDQMLNELKPWTKLMSEKLNVPPLPPKGECSYLAKHYYNNAVKETFQFMHELPNITKLTINQTLDMFGNYADNLDIEDPELLLVTRNNNEANITETSVNRKPKIKDDITCARRNQQSHYD